MMREPKELKTFFFGSLYVGSVGCGMEARGWRRVASDELYSGLKYVYTYFVVYEFLIRKVGS